MWRPVVDRNFFPSQLEQFLPCVYLPHSWSLRGCLLVSPLLHLRLALVVSILANNEIPKRKKNSRIFCAVHSLTRIFRTNRTMCSLFLPHSWSSRGCCGLSSIFILLLLVTICFVNDDVKEFSKVIWRPVSDLILFPVNQNNIFSGRPVLDQIFPGQSE